MLTASTQPSMELSCISGGHSGLPASDGFLLQAGAKARQKRSRFIDDIAAVDTDEEEDEEDVSVPLVVVFTWCRFGYAWHAIW